MTVSGLLSLRQGSELAFSPIGEESDLMSRKIDGQFSPMSFVCGEVVWKSASELHLVCLARSFQVYSAPSPTGQVALGAETVETRRRRLFLAGHLCRLSFLYACLARTSSRRQNLAGMAISGVRCQVEATVALQYCSKYRPIILRHGKTESRLRRVSSAQDQV
jgi:hypothetical protein